jgi:hypothetical protein
MTLVPKETRPTSAVSGSSDSTCMGFRWTGDSVQWRNAGGFGGDFTEAQVRAGRDTSPTAAPKQGVGVEQGCSSSSGCGSGGVPAAGSAC